MARGGIEPPISFLIEEKAVLPLKIDLMKPHDTI
jgi:hypothetical protein